MVSEGKRCGHVIFSWLPTFFKCASQKCRWKLSDFQMGAAKLTAKFMELMASSPEDQLGDNLKAVMKDGRSSDGRFVFLRRHMFFHIFGPKKEWREVGGTFDLMEIIVSTCARKHNSLTDIKDVYVNMRLVLYGWRICVLNAVFFCKF